MNIGSSNDPFRLSVSQFNGQGSKYPSFTYSAYRARGVAQLSLKCENIAFVFMFAFLSPCLREHLAEDFG